MSETIKCPSDSRLTFEVEFHPAEKQTGEWNYSLGDPPKEKWAEIIAVSFNDGTNIVDITDFVTEYADHLLPKWEDELIKQ